MSQYKISKKRLAEIIKEEYQSLQHRKTRRLTEDASDDTFDMVDVIVQALGPQQALEELVQAMERSNAHDLLGHVMQMHDMRMPGDEVEDYDPSAYNRQEDEEIEEGYGAALDRSRDDDARERRRQMQRIRDEDERKRQSGGYSRPGASAGMGGIGGGGSGKKRFAGFNRKDEELKGGQKELDKDDDGDIDAEDMAALRAKKKVKKESLDSIRQLIHKELKNL